MGTADKLALLKANKEAIRDAITEKIGEDAGEVMSTYAEKIRGIESKPKYYRTTILLDQTITDPATMITKVYDDGGIDMIRANSHRYVCKLVDDVLEAKQLQDGNGTLYLDGTTADLTGGEGDVFMKLPAFYYRAWSEESDKWYIDFAYGAAPDTTCKYWDGNDFIGVYEGYVSNSNLYSRSGIESSGSISQASFKSYARNRGNGYSCVKWKHHSMMAFLFYASYLSTNSQSIVGAGTDSHVKASGQTDLLGMEDTVAGVNGNTQSINFWGLENWWGNKFEWVDNVIVNETSANGVWSITEDDNSVRREVGVFSSGKYISKLKISNLDALPTAVSASATTGFCDYGRIDETIGVVLRRSYVGNDAQCGVAYIAAAYKGNSAAEGGCSRLVYRGEYKIIE